MSESIKFFYPKKNKEIYEPAEADLIVPNGTIDDAEVCDFLSNTNYIEYIYETMKLVIVDFSKNHNVEDTSILGDIDLFERKTYDFIIRRYSDYTERKTIEERRSSPFITDRRIKLFDSFNDVTNESEELTNRFCNLIK